MNATCFIVPLSLTIILSAVASVVDVALVPPSNKFNSAVVDVTPSNKFISVAVAVTPSRIFNSAAVEVTPSRIFNSAVDTVAPSSIATSVAVKSAIAAALPVWQPAKAVKSASNGCLLFNCVCIADVTPST